MPYDASLLRRATEERARKGKQHGQIADDQARVRQAGPYPIGIRDNAQFHDQSSTKQWWEGVWNEPWGG